LSLFPVIDLQEGILSQLVIDTLPGQFCSGDCLRMGADLLSQGIGKLWAVENLDFVFVYISPY